VALTPRRSGEGVRTALAVLSDAMVHDDPYTRFAAAVAMRKLAEAVCEPSHSTRLAHGLLAATLLGQLHSPPSSLQRLAREAQRLIRGCATAATGVADVSAAAEGPSPPSSASSLASSSANLIDSVVGADGSLSYAKGGVSVSDARPLESRRGIVGRTHCFARLRSLPARLFNLATARAHQAKRCDDATLSDLSLGRAHGVLLSRAAVSAGVREVSLAHHRKNSGAASGSAKRYHGRTTYRDAHMNEPRRIHKVNPRLLDDLDALLATWDRRGLTPPLPYRRGSVGELQVREIEHVVLDPAQHDCPAGPDAAGVPCGCDWHCDGGIRGYKLWVPLQKESLNHTNILVAPLSHVRSLCEIAASLEDADEGKRPTAAAAKDAADADEAAASRGDEMVRINATDALTADGPRMESQGELHARERDTLALESVSCTITAAPGDLLLFFPGVYHRTQDVAAYRIAMIAEATHGVDGGSDPDKSNALRP
jgi:hypothetical protein